MSKVGSARALLFLTFSAFLVASPAPKAQSPAPKVLAPTPPMGWNSWDAYGLTVDEKDFKANAEVLASMKQYGWLYAVIDEGWYMQNPFGEKTVDQKFLFDGNGLLIPDVSRFPSAAGNAGFKPLSDWLHQQGLKFGIHILRGVPKEVADKNLPIANSAFHTADATDRDSTCPWSDANYGIRDNAAGQAYYDSMLKRYAEWGLDFIKVDCISDRPYRPTEIRQIAEAIRKTGRPIVLSLSPGPTSLDNAAEVARYAQMWRITDDHWDVWMAANKEKGSEFPFGLKEEFDRIASWNKHAKPGSWPDPDMLPEGSLTPHPGLGEARQTHYTQDEQRSEFTLWAISRSPLIFGGNLTKLDDFNRSLMTNKKMLDANKWARDSHPITNLPPGFEKVRVWSAFGGVDCIVRYTAFFNLSDEPVTVHFTWKQLGLLQGKNSRCTSHELENLWDSTKVRLDSPMTLVLPTHGSAMFAW